MQQVYYATFLLGKDLKHTPSKEAITHVLSEWLFNKKPRRLKKPAEFELGKTRKFDIDGFTIETIAHRQEINSQIQEIFGATLAHEGASGERWLSACLFNQTTEGLRCCIEVQVGQHDNKMTQLQFQTSRPSLVPQLLKEFGGREVWPVEATAWSVSQEDIDFLLGLIESSDRCLPVVYISRTIQNKTLISPSELSDKLAGLAHVVVPASVEAGKSFNTAMKERHGAYNGALRIYWPNYNENESPFRHELWLPDQINAVPDWVTTTNLLQRVVRAATSRVSPEALRLTDLERIRFQTLRAELEKTQTTQAQQLVNAEDREIYEALLNEASSRSNEFQEQIGTLRQNLEALERERDYWKQMNFSKYEKNSEAQTHTEIKPDDVKRAFEMAIEQFGSRIIIIENRIEKEIYQYEQPEDIFNGLKWLATTYYDAKSSITQCEDLERDLKEAHGLTYSANQKKNIMKAYANEYRVDYAGDSHWLEAHIGKGVTRKPSETFRVAFFFYENGPHSKVVVGYAGQHQTNSKTN